MAKSKDSVSVNHARRLAKKLLRKSGERWEQTSGVAARAAELAGTIDAADRRLLLAAAWLHDIGYAPAPALIACPTSSLSPPGSRGLTRP